VLVNLKDIKANKPDEESHDLTVETLSQEPMSSQFVGHADQILKKYIGEIHKDRAIHFITSGRFSMHDLLLYVLKQTGPADVLISTWSISELAIRQIVQKHTEGTIRSIRFLIDPRVKVRNPKPLQMLVANFNDDLKLKACHAKVTLIENESWNISIVGSANYTQNPRIERGVIFPFRDIFEFDKNWITNEIGQRTT
jgi:hypothetical protein